MMIKNKKDLKQKYLYLAIGFVLIMVALNMTTKVNQAAPLTQNPEPTPEVKDCVDCHLDIANSWSQSMHAHAYDDEHFQEHWQEMDKPGNCLTCHTTNFIPSTGEYESEGVSCRACHGTTTNHPPEIIPTRADTDYCGSCHTTTLSEWRKTGHSTDNVGCMDCHNPHSQEPLFDNHDDLCINCHIEDMGDYLNDLHVKKDIGCVDCHALVIPPDEDPEDGIVPTGHEFSISPQTCVACHTDTLHAGFTLPGYENGAEEGGALHAGDSTTSEESEGAHPLTDTANETVLNPNQQIQALETALASSRVSSLFQGAIIGLVLGGSTVWIVGQNLRTTPSEEEEEDGL
jgi:hypothetical protein